MVEILREIAHLLGAEGEIAEADQRSQRRVLEVLDGEVAEGRHHLGDGLRQGDAPQGLALGEVERLGGLVLAPRYGLDGAAHDFGAIGADVEAERENAGGHGRQSQIDADGVAGDRQGEIEPEKLDQQRGAAEDLDIDDREALDRPVAGSLADTEGEGTQRAEDGRVDRQFDGDRGSLKERPEIFRPMHRRSAPLLSFARGNGRAPEWCPAQS